MASLILLPRASAAVHDDRSFVSLFVAARTPLSRLLSLQAKTESRVRYCQPRGSSMMVEMGLDDTCPVLIGVVIHASCGRFSPTGYDFFLCCFRSMLFVTSQWGLAGEELLDCSCSVRYGPMWKYSKVCSKCSIAQYTTVVSTVHYSTLEGFPVCLSSNIIEGY